MKAKSPSSRRAWIEIIVRVLPLLNVVVALLAEGVDRNIMDTVIDNTSVRVALLAEGVDRNLEGLGMEFLRIRRPPRGGRG